MAIAAGTRGECLSRPRGAEAGVVANAGPADYQVWRSNCWQIPKTTAASIMTAATSMTLILQ
jgi:hypothetical protein